MILEIYLKLYMATNESLIIFRVLEQDYHFIAPGFFLNQPVMHFGIASTNSIELRQDILYLRGSFDANDDAFHYSRNSVNGGQDLYNKILIILEYFADYLSTRDSKKYVLTLTGEDTFGIGEA